ncbi:TPA: cytidyltransferase, partial [Candidatus Spyradomonas excrementavium]|nr:cytidyltransferase [Candidatus Spyradomonas excrementavium]
MKVYAFVPAKGSSERVENKNMRYLDGERLYAKALKTLLNCKEIDKVFLDTESEEMY